MTDENKFVEFNGVWVINYWPKYFEACQKVNTYTINNKEYPRIPYGFEKGRETRPIPCRNCAASNGQFHIPYCDLEQCPVCWGQVETCGCDYDKEEIKLHCSKMPKANVDDGC